MSGTVVEGIVSASRALNFKTNEAGVSIWEIASGIDRTFFTTLHPSSDKVVLFVIIGGLKTQSWKLPSNLFKDLGKETVGIEGVLNGTGSGSGIPV